MSTFVLVHGAWHGSWCWDEVVSQLQAAGHNAVTLDLPGRAGDTTPYRQISLASYTDKVRRVVELQSEPVVLVGHSMGGISISASAEQIPDRVRALVFVCAYLLRNGQSLMEVAQSDTNGSLLPYVAIDQAEACLRVAADAPLADIFYGHCSPSHVARARAMLVAEPLMPGATPLALSADRYGRVPRVYVETTTDNTVPIELQRRMYEASPCARVVTLETDHSPFFSAPAALAAALASI